MQRYAAALSSFLLLSLHLLWQTAPSPAIHSPVGGQALQGIVQILGSTAIEGFQSAELSFAYFNNPTDTWFIISESDAQVENDEIAEWDTTTISDGDYILRLVVKLNDGSELSTTVEGVRVRNYSPIEADTPTATVPTPTLRPSETLAPTQTSTSTATPTVIPVVATPTPPPPNPAELSRAAIYTGIGKGVLATIGCFAILGILNGIRSLIRRR